MSADPAPARPLFNLWPKGNPGGWTCPEPEVTEQQGWIKITKNVNTPTLEYWAAPNPAKNAPTVIVCPGGGYNILAIEHEGWEIAQLLNDNGINAAILKYRLPVPNRDKVRHQAAWEDAQRAIRIMRSRSGELKINPAKVGIMGFSAGGHLSAYTSNHTEPSTQPVDDADKELSRPDFTVLIYCAYLLEEGKAALSPTIPVSKKTPPAFLVHTMDDPITVESSLMYMAACKAKGVPCEGHFYPKGGHGYGMRSDLEGLKDWPSHLVGWLKRL